jgi:hypothetical protein
MQASNRFLFIGAALMLAACPLLVQGQAMDPRPRRSAPAERSDYVDLQGAQSFYVQASVQDAWPHVLKAVTARAPQRDANITASGGYVRTQQALAYVRALTSSFNLPGVDERTPVLVTINAAIDETRSGVSHVRVKVFYETGGNEKLANALRNFPEVDYDIVQEIKDAVAAAASQGSAKP